MNDEPKWRGRLRYAVEEYFRRRRSPQFILGLVLLITGFAGFGISLGLLRSGMGDMWLRYPLAVIGAYLVFLLLMRLWVEIERRHFNPDDLVIPEKEPLKPTLIRERGSWLDGLADLPNGLNYDLGEGCLPSLLIGIVLGLFLILVAALAGAPALLAEIFIDAFLAGVLYRRLKIAAREHWLGTAIRKTWFFVLGTAFLLCIGGSILAILAPGAQTIGDAIEYFFSSEG